MTNYNPNPDEDFHRDQDEFMKSFDGCVDTVVYTLFWILLGTILFVALHFIPK